MGCDAGAARVPCCSVCSAFACLGEGHGYVKASRSLHSHLPFPQNLDGLMGELAAHQRTRRLRAPNVMCYNALLGAYSKCQQTDHAMALLDWMESSSKIDTRIIPDAISYNTGEGHGVVVRCGDAVLRAMAADGDLGAFVDGPAVLRSMATHAADLPICCMHATTWDTFAAHPSPRSHRPAGSQGPRRAGPPRLPPHGAARCVAQPHHLHPRGQHPAPEGPHPALHRRPPLAQPRADPGHGERAQRWREM